MGNIFGFVRVTKVKDVNALVNQLCDMWFGFYKLYATIMRFTKEVMMGDYKKEFHV